MASPTPSEGQGRPAVGRVYLPIALGAASAPETAPRDGVVEDPDATEPGEIWMAYANAVGNVTTNRGNHPSLGDVLHVARLGEVWVATGYGVVAWDVARGSYRLIYEGTAGALEMDVTGNIWIGTWTDGLHRISPDGRWTSGWDTPSKSRIWCLDSDDAGNVYYCAANGVTKLAPDGTLLTYWGSTETTDVFDGLWPIWDLEVEADGAVWVVTNHAILRLLPDGTSERVRDGLASVMDVAIDRDGSAWFSHWGNGLLHRTPDGRWTTFRASTDGLLDNLVFDITIGPDGARWFGTPNGVGRLDPDGTWHRYGAEDGLPGAEVRATAFDPEGNTWFASSGGLGQLPPKAHDGAAGSAPIRAWRTAPGAMPGRSVERVAVTADGSVWTAMPGLGLARRDPSGSWEAYSTDDPDSALLSNTITHLLADPVGNLWIATEGGVNRIDPQGRWHALTTQDGLPDERVKEIAIAPDGRAWIATANGVAVRAVDGTIPRWRSDPLYMWYRDGTVGVDFSPALDGQTIRHAFALPSDLSPAGIVDMAVLPDGRTIAWHDDQTYTVGSTDDPAAYGRILTDRYAPPEGKGPRDIVAIDRTEQQRTVVWYRDGTVTEGDARYIARTPLPDFTLPPGLAPDDLIDVAIGADGRAFAWYRDGTMSIGDLADLDRHAPPTPFALAPGKTPADIVGIGFWRPGNLRSITVDGAGNVWMVRPTTGSSGDALLRLTPDARLRGLIAARELPADVLGRLSTDPEGNVWAGNRGLTAFSPQGEMIERVESTQTDGVIHWETRIVQWSPDGAAWVVTSTGIWRRAKGGDEWKRMGDGWTANLLDPNDIAFEPDGTAWLSAKGGLFRRLDQGVSDACISALPVDATTSVGSAIESPDDVDIFRFDVDTPFTAVEIGVLDPDNRLEVGRACLDAGGESIRASASGGRHIGGSVFVGYEHRHRYVVGSQTGTQYVAVRARPGAHQGAPLRYVLRIGQASGAPVDQTRTLILTHRPRMEALFPGSVADWDRWEGRLRTLADHPEVRGRLVTDLADVEQVDPAVAEAYAEWLGTPPSDAHVAAPAFVRAVRDWIGQLRAEHMPYLNDIVLAGDDRVIPFDRVRIAAPAEARWGWQPESAYMRDQPLDPRSRTGSSLAADFTLTDDAYGLGRPVPWGERDLRIDLPRLAVGRLVESPEDMTAVVDAFLARDGILPVERTVAAGYAFMADGPEIGDGYLGRYGGIPEADRRRVFGAERTRSEWHDALLGAPADLRFFAAHATHYLLETPDGGALHAADVAGAAPDAAGRLVFGLACHAGLNVPGGSEHREPLDFPEAWLRRGATYIGTTGYAYGLDGALQYQEDLMAEFTRRLAAGATSVGDALRQVKRDHYWDMGRASHYHAKTIAGTVLYGLPMWRVETRGGELATEPEDWVTCCGDSPLTVRGETVATRRFALDVRAGAWRRNLLPDAEYYELPDRPPRPEAGEPTQPRLRIASHAESVFARGQSLVWPVRSVVWLGGRFRTLPDFRPWILSAEWMGRPARGEALRFGAPGWYPSLPASLRTQPPLPGTTPDDAEDLEGYVVLTMGQYHEARRMARLFDSSEVLVYYGDAADIDPPVVTAVDAAPSGDGIALTIHASDPSGIADVHVTWASARGDRWQSVSATTAGDGTWSTTIPADAEALVQVVDGAGNAAMADNGGSLFP